MIAADKTPSEKAREAGELKIAVEKALAFEIDPTKRYLVTFTSKRPLDIATMEKIKEQMLRVFTEMGTQCQVVVLSDGVSLDIKQTAKPQGGELLG